jgi:hypothetical protein
VANAGVLSVISDSGGDPLEGMIQRRHLSGKMAESTAPEQAHDLI